MRYLAALCILALSGCSDDFTLRLFLPIPVEQQAMSDSEFSEFFDEMSDAEQVEYVEKYGTPRNGFVSP